MYFKQFYLACLSHASYLIADEESKTAAVIDPQRDIDQYLAEAKKHKYTIRHVLLTHFHADFVSGHLELAEATGATIYLGAKAEADYEFIPLSEGDSIDFGKVRLSALETPGHTPEAISILVFDNVKNKKAPQSVLTGDTLFIGDVGRPDLMASIGISADDLARMLYHSLHDKLLKLPDATSVYPAHGAGSLCGKNLSSEKVSTIGAQKLSNYALKPMSEDEFVQLVTADQPESPAYFAYDAELNKRLRPILRRVLQTALKPLPLESFLDAQKNGAQVLDARDADEFAAGHLKGSMNISLDGRYATWAGVVLGREKDIALVAAHGHEEEAVLRLGRIGFDRVLGYLEGGATAFNKRKDLVSSFPRLSPQELAQALKAKQPPLVLDVRNPGEREASHIPGSLFIPLSHLSKRIKELPHGRPIVVHCAGGYRSAIAVGLLESAGLKDLSDLAGGMAAWNELEK